LKVQPTTSIRSVPKLVCFEFWWFSGVGALSVERAPNLGFQCFLIFLRGGGGGLGNIGSDLFWLFSDLGALSLERALKLVLRCFLIFLQGGVWETSGVTLFGSFLVLELYL
jgi:hypothetical protein